MSDLTDRILFWPCVRKEIQDHFKLLLDEEFKQTWFSTTFKHAFWDSLDYYVFDYLIDGPVDMIDNDGRDAIGVSLYNKHEAIKISQYLNFYNDTFKGNMPDSYYINHPKWNEVINGAREIVKMMEENNKKYNLEQDIDKWWQFDEDYHQTLSSQERDIIYDRDLAECRRKAMER